MQIVPSTENTYKTANSYLSIADGEDLLKMNKQYNEWAGLADNEKGNALINASLIVDGICSWKGKKTDPNQILQFPRQGDKTVPITIKFAVMHIIANLLSHGAFKDVEEEQIGSIRIRYSKQISNAGDAIIAMLSPLKKVSMKINQ